MGTLRRSRGRDGRHERVRRVGARQGRDEAFRLHARGGRRGGSDPGCQVERPMSALAGMPSDAGAKLNSQAILLADEPRAELRKLEQTWAEAGNVRRLWRKDSTLWTGGEEGKWLDWLGIVDAELERI